MSASTWLIVTIVTGVIGSAAGVIGTRIGDVVTTPGQPGGPPILVSAVYYGPSNASMDFALPTVRHLSSSQLTGLATSGRDPHPQNFERFIESSRGAPADGSGGLQLTLRGNRPYPVLITGMQVKKQCGPPMKGTLFYSPPAAQAGNAMIGFNLNKPIPQADIIKSDGKLGPSYFLLKHISLNGSQDTQVMSVDATTSGSCSFRLVMRVLDKSKTVYETIGDSTRIGGGPPFRITQTIGGSNGPNFAAYGIVYVGGVMDDQCDDAWTRVNSTFSLTEPSSAIVCNRT